MRNIFIICLLVMFSTITYARCVGPVSVVNGQCLGTEVYGSDDSSGYQGSSGSSYQYDLNNGSDRNSYSTDLGAQRRDQMNLNSGNLDGLRGQQGGGIYDY